MLETALPPEWQPELSCRPKLGEKKLLHNFFGFLFFTIHFLSRILGSPLLPYPGDVIFDAYIHNSQL